MSTAVKSAWRPSHRAFPVFTRSSSAPRAIPEQRAGRGAWDVVALAGEEIGLDLAMTVDRERQTP